MEREKKVKKRRKARLEAMTEPTETGLHGGVFSMKKVKVGKDKIKRTSSLITGPMWRSMTTSCCTYDS